MDFKIGDRIRFTKKGWDETNQEDNYSTSRINTTFTIGRIVTTSDGFSLIYFEQIYPNYYVDGWYSGRFELVGEDSVKDKIIEKAKLLENRFKSRILREVPF